MKEALQARIKRKIPHNHAIMTWLVEQADESVTKWQASHDGKTSYQRLMGKPCSEETVVFG